MSRADAPEYKLLAAFPFPQQIELCMTCRNGIVVYLGGDTYLPIDQTLADMYQSEPGRRVPRCTHCGENRPGLVYRIDGKTPPPAESS